MASMELYRKQLESLQKIRDLTRGHGLTLPQIVVVGDQSSGKSSLLTELTGVKFPVRAGICTKAPIVVQCKGSKQQVDARFSIGDGVDQKEVGANALPTEIENMQHEALRVSGGRKISTQEIRVVASGDSLPDVILVDLPGIINVGEGKEETRTLINSYIKHETTLIMLVSEAKTDCELVTAIELARAADPTDSRTMRVFTKFDTFDSPAAKTRACQLVAGGSESAAAISLDPHAVVCQPSGGPYDAQVEKEELVGLPAERAGIAALKDRLPVIFSKLINQNLPQLRETVNDRLARAKTTLSIVGEEPLSKGEMMREAQSIFSGQNTRLEEVLSTHMRTFQAAVHATGERVKKEWTDTMYCPNSFRNPIFQGEDAANACMKEMCNFWQIPLTTLLDSIKEVAERHVRTAMQERHRLPEQLSRAIIRAWNDHSKESQTKLSGACNEEKKREFDFGTMNHYLTASFQVDTVMPQECLERLVAGMESSTPGSPPPTSGSLFGSASGKGLFGSPPQLNTQQTLASNPPALTAAQIRQKWEDTRAGLQKEYERKDVHEQQRERVFRAVQAQWQTEHKTFTDNILKTVRDQVVRGKKRWVQELFSHEGLQRNAVEDTSTQERRVKARQTIQHMNQCLQELDQL